MFKTEDVTNMMIRVYICWFSEREGDIESLSENEKKVLLFALRKIRVKGRNRGNVCTVFLEF